MNSTQQLYYALGEMAYAVATADGKLQDAEKRKFWSIVVSHKAWVGDFDFAEVIFQLLQKDKASTEDTYTNAIKTLEQNKHHLSAQMINSFKEILTSIAEAFPPVTPDEKQLLLRFKTEIDRIGAHAV
jgi:hypothetical protein